MIKIKKKLTEIKILNQNVTKTIDVFINSEVRNMNSDYDIGELNGLTLRYHQYGNVNILALFDKVDDEEEEYFIPVAFMKCEYLHSFPEITLTYTESEYRGKGLMKSLISYWVFNFGKIMSDSHQSTDAKNMWLSLIKNPPIGLQVKMFNITRHVIYDIDNNDPWDGNEDNRLILIKKP